MYKRIWLIVVPLAALSLSGRMAIGSGGTKVGINDNVDALIGHNGTNFYAFGAMGTVRSEPNGPGTETQFIEKWIGCWVDSTLALDTQGLPTPGTGNAWVTCTATSENTDGNVGTRHSLRCVSRDPVMIAAVGAMNADSMITFETPTAPVDGSGQCVHIKVENLSKYNAKAP